MVHSVSGRTRGVQVDLGARAEAAKVQPKNVWAEAEPNFSWAEAGKCLSQPSQAGKILTSIFSLHFFTATYGLLRHLNVLNGITYCIFISIIHWS